MYPEAMHNEVYKYTCEDFACMCMGLLTSVRVHVDTIHGLTYDRNEKKKKKTIIGKYPVCV